MPTFTVGPFTYPTKREAEEAIRSVLHRAPVGQPLEGADYLLIRSLIDMHPSADAKIGSGIDRIAVEIIEFGARGFWIYRTDGSQTDFSYRKALTRPSHRNEVTAALRRSIADQVAAFLDETFANADRVACPVTGANLGRRDGHVDHVIPFATIVDEFLKASGSTFDDIRLTSADGQIGKRLESEALERNWQSWHASHAQLRFIHAAANRRRGAA